MTNKKEIAIKAGELVAILNVLAAVDEDRCAVADMVLTVQKAAKMAVDLQVMIDEAP